MMTHIVSITSQGQISIPADIRRALGLDKYKIASIRQEEERMIVEPVKDLLESKGIFKHKAIKGKSIDEIMKMEEEAWEKSAAKKYLASLKR